MKKIFFFLLLAPVMAKDVFATEWATYYIYVQKDYLQGPWKRADWLGQLDSYQYLHPQQFEELFGSEPISLASSIFSHLREETPERYAFQSTLTISGDTVIIQTPGSVADFDAVKNELTASFVLNNFSVVKIIRQGKAALYGLKDITVPYMDLVFPGGKETLLFRPDSITADTAASGAPAQPAVKGQPGNKLSAGLIVSVIMNILLAALLLRKRK